jgi:hypothetical protein
MGTVKGQILLTDLTQEVLLIYKLKYSCQIM